MRKVRITPTHRTAVDENGTMMVCPVMSMPGHPEVHCTDKCAWFALDADINGKNCAWCNETLIGEVIGAEG